jgi:Family of unknown function (DUF6194)
MDVDTIIRYMRATFPGVELDTTTPTTFFFVGADHKFPFVTIKTTDDASDRASQLDRSPERFRLNVGVGRPTYKGLFPHTSDHDFTAVDRILPHPVYAKMYWVCAICPSELTFERMKPLLAEAYAIASAAQVRRPSRTART